jgi:hypothetical protein
VSKTNTADYFTLGCQANAKSFPSNYQFSPSEHARFEAKTRSMITPFSGVLRFVFLWPEAARTASDENHQCVEYRYTLFIEFCYLFADTYACVLNNLPFLYPLIISFLFALKIA